MNASVSFLPPTDFSGLWVPLITPFVGQAVDHEALGRLVKHLVDAGVSGLVVCGSTGEAAALTAEEQLAVLPAASVTVKVLVVVPTGKKLPEGSPAVCRRLAPGRLSLKVGAV